MVWVKTISMGGILYFEHGGCIMKDKSVTDYKKEPPVINITKPTMDILLKQPKPDQLIALYLFYSYTSTWQHTLQIKATTAYTAQAMGWGEQKLHRVKKQLLKLGLIEDKQTRNHQHITGHYIRIYYFSTPCKMPGVAKNIGKCLVTGNNKCLVTNSRHSKSGDSKTTPNSFDKAASTKLYSIILTQKNINLNTRQWPDIFRRLRTVNKIPPQRIRKVLDWYGENIGEEFVPVAHCARTFREKFSRIEEAKKRHDKNGDRPRKKVRHRKRADGTMEMALR
jgi:hypothetical protein